MEFLDDVKQRIGFADDDAGVLEELQPLLAGEAPGIAERLCDSLLGQRHISSLLSADAENASRLQRNLVSWMQSGLSGPHDQTFYERRTHIGQRDAELGLDQSSMIAAIGSIRTAYRTLLSRALGHDLARYDRAMLAVERLLDLELAIALEAHRGASDERLRQLEHDATLAQRLRLTERLAAVGTLCSGFAHELRNPINGADLQLQVLERRMAHVAELAAPLREPLVIARDELGRMSRLVTDFLAFARPRRPQRVTVDVGSLLRRGAARMVERGRTRGVDVKLRLPQVAVIARLDIEQVEQLVHELLTNAIDAAHRDVEIALTLAEGSARLGFRDDGPGIAAADRARVFEPFFTAKPSGTGLGLSIVHSIVEAHGGSIVIGGDGCTEVLVDLPLEA